MLRRHRACRGGVDVSSHFGILISVVSKWSICRLRQPQLRAELFRNVTLNVILFGTGRILVVVLRREGDGGVRWSIAAVRCWHNENPRSGWSLKPPHRSELEMLKKETRAGEAVSRWE